MIGRGLIVGLVFLLGLLSGCTEEQAGQRCSVSGDCAEENLRHFVFPSPEIQGEPSPDAVSELEDEPEVALEASGPVITLESPAPYAEVFETITIRFQVSDDTGVDDASVKASVEGWGAVALTEITTATYEGTVERGQLAEGLSFPLLTIEADDLEGNHSEYFRRLVVDNRVAVVTSLSANVVTAGTSLGVTCRFMRGLEEVSTSAAAVTVSPAVSTLVMDGAGAIFTPTVAGTYRVHCSSEDGSMVDAQGQEVRVVAGAAFSTDTLIADPDGRAGDRVLVECRAFDLYDNELGFPVWAGLSVDSGVETQHLGGRLFSVRATRVGDYEVGCSLGGLEDGTPALLSVSAGDPALTTSRVSVSGGPSAENAVVSPLEAVEVHCAATDAFGNPVPGATLHYSLVPSDGRPPVAYGVVQSSDTFYGTKAGYVFVVCGVDGFYAEDETPARVRIASGLPYLWEVNVLEQDCYWAGRRLPMVMVVYDYWGNIISDPDLELLSIPEGGVVKDSAGVYRLGPDGDFDVTLSLQGPKHSENLIRDYVLRLRVDSTPPLISITSPERGETLAQGTLSPMDVSVEGLVVDDVSPITMVRLNGETVEVGGEDLSVDLSQIHSSRWGLSVVTAEAEDECGNFGVRAQSYLRSPSYYDAADEGGASGPVSQGIAARLNQTVLDDEKRGDLNDLASLAQAVVANTDLNAAMPEVLGVSPDEDGDGNIDLVHYNCGVWTEENENTGYKVWKTGDFVAGDVDFEYLRAVNGGVHLRMSMDNVYLPLGLYGNWDAGCFGDADVTVFGAVSVSSARLEATVMLSLEGSDPAVSMEDVTVNLVDPYVDLDFESRFLEWMIEGVLNAVLNSLKGQVEDILGAQLSDAIGPLLKSFLGDFSIATAIEIPEPIGMTLQLGSGLDYLQFAGPEGSGYGDLGLYTQVYPSARGASIPADARGAIRRGGERPEFGDSYAFGVGLKDDLINQVLWAAWYGGALDIADAGGLLGQDMGDISLSFEALSPPVMMPGPGAPGHDIEMGIGDAFIEASVAIPDMGTLEMSMYLSAIIGGSMDLDPTTNELIISLDSTNPQVWVEITEIGEPAIQGEMSVLFTEVLGAIVPRLLSAVVGSIPLPTFDVGGLAGLPVSEVWELSNGDIERVLDYYRLTGGLK